MKMTSRQVAKIKSAPGDTARHKDREFTAKLVQILNFGFSWTVCCCWPTSNDENGCNSGNFLLFCYRRKGGDGFGDGIKEGSKHKKLCRSISRCAQVKSRKKVDKKCK